MTDKVLLGARPMFTFTKDERLTSKKKIGQLFSVGNRFYSSPFQVIWMRDSFESLHPARVLIAVSRRKLKKAVDRNHVKRLIREAYRLNKSSFYTFLQENHSKCSFALIYNSSSKPVFKEVEEKILLILQRLEREYEKDNR